MNVNDYNKENISENTSQSPTNHGKLKSVTVTNYKSDHESKGKIDELEVDKIQHLQEEVAKLNEKIIEVTHDQHILKNLMGHLSNNENNSEKNQKLSQTSHEVANVANETYQIVDEIDSKKVTQNVFVDETFRKKCAEFIKNRFEKYQHNFIEQRHLAGGEGPAINYERIEAKIANEFEKHLQKFDTNDQQKAVKIFKNELKSHLINRHLDGMKDFVKNAIERHENHLRQLGHLAGKKTPINYDKIKVKVNQEIIHHLEKNNLPTEAFEFFKKELDNQIGARQIKSKINKE